MRTYACVGQSMAFIYLMHDDPEHKFDLVITSLLFSGSLGDALNKVEWIEIRSGGIIQTQKIENLASVVEVPPFRDGIFARLILK